MFFLRTIRNLFLITILFLIGCYFADGKETLENINRKVQNGYEKIVSSTVYDRALNEIFAGK